jgi:hypothetical protein
MIDQPYETDKLVVTYWAINESYKADALLDSSDDVWAVDAREYGYNAALELLKQYGAQELDPEEFIHAMNFPDEYISVSIEIFNPDEHTQFNPFLDDEDGFY